jgi:hypothetical protein
MVGKIFLMEGSMLMWLRDPDSRQYPVFQGTTSCCPKLFAKLHLRFGDMLDSTRTESEKALGGSDY